MANRLQHIKLIEDFGTDPIPAGNRVYVVQHVTEKSYVSFDGMRYFTTFHLDFAITFPTDQYALETSYGWPGNPAMFRIKEAVIWS